MRGVMKTLASWGRRLRSAGPRSCPHEPPPGRWEMAAQMLGPLLFLGTAVVYTVGVPVLGESWRAALNWLGPLPVFAAGLGWVAADSVRRRLGARRLGAVRVCEHCAASLADAGYRRSGLVCARCARLNPWNPLTLMPEQATESRSDKSYRIGPIVFWHGEPHREFPALRGFSHRVGRRYYLEALDWSRGRLAAARVGAVLAGVLALVGVAGGLFALLSAVRSTGLLGPPAVPVHESLFLVPIAIGAIAGFGTGIWAYKCAVHAAVSERLRTDRCGHCDYPFIDLKPQMGILVCPECGADVPDPGEMPPLLLERCPRCRYSLEGLPAEHGMVRCPECGTESPDPGRPVALGRPDSITPTAAPTGPGLPSATPGSTAPSDGTRPSRSREA